MPAAGRTATLRLLIGGETGVAGNQMATQVLNSAGGDPGAARRLAMTHLARKEEVSVAVAGRDNTAARRRLTGIEVAASDRLRSGPALLCRQLSNMWRKAPTSGPHLAAAVGSMTGGVRKEFFRF
jgi:hypothetical protein